MTNSPAAKRLKTSQERSKTRTIIHVDEFHLASDCHYGGEIRTNKNGRKFAALQASTTDPSRVLLQFNGGGSIPPFGIKTETEHEDGNTSLIFNIDHEAEVESLRQLTSNAIQMAIANKSTWWPKGISNEQIRDNFASLFSEKKLKTSGDGYWPAQMKVKIPMDSVTGEVKSCDIQNSDQSDLPITELPGSKWDTVVLEFAGFYFSGKYTWGVVKQLFKLKSSSDQKVEMDPKKISFLPKKMTRELLPIGLATEYISSTGLVANEFIPSQPTLGHTLGHTALDLKAQPSTQPDLVSISTELIPSISTELIPSIPADSIPTDNLVQQIIQPTGMEPTQLDLIAEPSTLPDLKPIQLQPQQARLELLDSVAL